VAHREAGSTDNVFAYFSGLGVDADMDAIEAELRALKRCLGDLPAMSFLDVGAGPSGTFTLQLPGVGIALDQSQAALRLLRTAAPDLPAVRGDAMALPLPARSVGRALIAHLYGLLLPDERAGLLAEARRVADEVVILDSGRPVGARAEEWQSRRLPDGSTYPIFRRHLDADTLVHEVGGEALFDGEYFVMVRSRCLR
jgi:ubiquinone/menaquinone biosynthesis C-methylase UbiE